MKTIFRITFTAVALAAICYLSVGYAQDKAQWSGTWRMNTAKSKLNPLSPTKLIVKLELKDGVVSETTTMTSDDRESSFSATYTTDGKEREQEVIGRNAKTSAKWEGATLILTIQAGDYPLVRKFSLSADGKTMTMVRPMNDLSGHDDTFVLEKQ